jgi:hypothetical protein
MAVEKRQRGFRDLRSKRDQRATALPSSVSVSRVGGWASTVGMYM